MRLRAAVILREYCSFIRLPKYFDSASEFSKSSMVALRAAAHPRRFFQKRRCLLGAASCTRKECRRRVGA